MAEVMESPAAAAEVVLSQAESQDNQEAGNLQVSEVTAETTVASTVDSGVSTETTKKKKKKKGLSVGFMDTVTIRELPSDEADEAVDTRKGEWAAAPDHDELWDGDSKEFWEKEKSLDEVHRIVMIRQLRLTLQYNFGCAFFGIVGNFKKRRGTITEKDVVPSYENEEMEDKALRKELRDLFQDSVKGLEFSELIKDREAFDKMCNAVPKNLSGIEQVIDEVLYSGVLCMMMSIPFIGEAASLPRGEVLQAKIDEEEKRRVDQRSQFEAQNNGISALGERRASMESRKFAEAQSASASNLLALAQQQQEQLSSVSEIEEMIPPPTSTVAVPATVDPDKNIATKPAAVHNPPSPVVPEVIEAQASAPPVTVTSPSIPAESAISAGLRRFGSKQAMHLLPGKNVFSEVFEGSMIPSEDRVKYSLLFLTNNVSTVKALAALSTSDLTSMGIKVFDAKQIVRRSWVLSRKSD